MTQVTRIEFDSHRRDDEEWNEFLKRTQNDYKSIKSIISLSGVIDKHQLLYAFYFSFNKKNKRTGAYI